jgi:flagellar biosynthesis/type III secretory pathway protein FliH
MECGSSACRLRNILQSQTLPGKIKSTVRMVSLQQYEVVNPATTSRQLVVEHSQEDQQTGYARECRQGMQAGYAGDCRQGVQESAEEGMQERAGEGRQGGQESAGRVCRRVQAECRQSAGRCRQGGQGGRWLTKEGRNAEPCHTARAKVGSKVGGVSTPQYGS